MTWGAALPRGSRQLLTPLAFLRVKNYPPPRARSAEREHTSGGGGAFRRRSRGQAPGGGCPNHVPPDLRRVARGLAPRRALNFLGWRADNL